MKEIQKKIITKLSLLIGGIYGITLGIIQPLILLWTEQSMFNACVGYVSPSQNVTMTFAEYQSLNLNSMYLCVESLAFCSLATFCLTYYIINRKNLAIGSNKNE